MFALFSHCKNCISFNFINKSIDLIKQTNKQIMFYIANQVYNYILFYNKLKLCE